MVILFSFVRTKDFSTDKLWMFLESNDFHQNSE